LGNESKIWAKSDIWMNFLKHESLSESNLSIKFGKHLNQNLHIESWKPAYSYEHHLTKPTSNFKKDKFRRVREKSLWVNLRSREKKVENLVQFHLSWYLFRFILRQIKDKILIKDSMFKNSIRNLSFLSLNFDHFLMSYHDKYHKLGS
jgi:hypothetical protein